MGRIVETSGAGCRASRSAPADDPQDDVVLHLLKESAPELTNGFTMRSRYNLLAQAGAGLKPVVVTSLGFPGSSALGTSAGSWSSTGSRTTAWTSVIATTWSARSTSCWRTRRG